MAFATSTEIQPKERWWTILRSRLIAHLQQREEQIFLLLSLLIGALTGLAVVAFIVVTERLGMRLYPVGSAAWRRVLVPVAGSLAMGVLLYRYFPNARGSGVPQTNGWGFIEAAGGQNQTGGRTQSDSHCRGGVRRGRVIDSRLSQKEQAQIGVGCQSVEQRVCLPAK